LRPWSLSITWKTRQLNVDVEPDITTFSDVIEKILMQLKKQDEVCIAIFIFVSDISFSPIHTLVHIVPSILTYLKDRIFEYNLVMFKRRVNETTPEAIWLEPMKYVSSLPSNVRCEI
jgi:hypothetical protein